MLLRCVFLISCVGQLYCCFQYILYFIYVEDAKSEYISNEAIKICEENIKQLS